MVEIVSKRERIVDIFRERLAAVFPESTIERGFFDESVTNYDRFYLFDLPETCELGSQHRGMYHCSFPLSISYWVQMAKEELFPAGNLLLERIRLAVETDERLNNLVIGYSMEEGALVWYDEGVLDVELLYIVEYTKDAGWVSNPFKKG